MKRWQRTAAFLLVTGVCPSAVDAAFRNGDVVHMSHRSKVAGIAEEKRENPWEEALRSQMPRFGRPGTAHFQAAPPDGARYSADEDELAVALAFSQEQFVLRPIAIKEGRRGVGNSGGALLNRLVVTFACAAGDIVSVRSDPVYGETDTDTTGPLGFDIEYRWDRLPDEDTEAGVWVVFAASLVLTVTLAVDACNSTAEDEANHRDGYDDDDDDGGGGGRARTSSSSPSSGFRGGAGVGRERSETRRVGGGRDVARVGGEGEVRRRR